MQTHKQALYGARIALAIMTVVLSLGFLYRVPTLLAQDACPADLPTRLSVGTQGRVRSDGPNDMHAEPGLDASYSGEVQALGVFDIVEGPICANDAVWWKVNFFGLIGWTQEGRDGVYWLNPHTAVAPTPRPTQVTNTTSQSSQSSSSATDAPFGEASLERLWMHTFDDSANWNQINSNSFVGEVKDGMYVMQPARVPGGYSSDDFIELGNILPVSSLEKFELAFDVQSQTPDIRSQCGMVLFNQESLEQMQIVFCHGLLGMMPIAYEYGRVPAGGSSAPEPMRIAVDAMDGGIHRIKLIGDGQTLRLYVDGQGGLTYPYSYSLKSFILAHIDLLLQQQSDVSAAVLKFDNVTLSRPQECQLIVTVAIKDVVIEALNGASPTGLAEATFYYGVTDDADGYVTQDEEAVQRLEGLAAMAYEADLAVGDRVTGFPTITRPVSCSGALQEVFFNVYETRTVQLLNSYGEPIGSKTTPFYENNLSNFPMEVSAEITSTDSLRVYRVTYTVDVKPSDGTLVATSGSGGDMSGVQIEHNPPTVTEECQLIITVTISEFVVESLDTTLSNEPKTIRLRYGLYYNANETLQSKDAPIDDAIITYEADLMAGDRVTGLPPFKHVIPCAGLTKQGYYRIAEEDEYLRDRNFFINQNRLYDYPVRGTDEFTSPNGTARRYRLSYSVEIERVQGQGTEINGQAADMSTIQIEHNP